MNGLTHKCPICDLQCEKTRSQLVSFKNCITNRNKELTDLKNKMKIRKEKYKSIQDANARNIEANRNKRVTMEKRETEYKFLRKRIIQIYGHEAFYIRVCQEY